MYVPNSIATCAGARDRTVHVDWVNSHLALCETTN